MDPLSASASALTILGTLSATVQYAVDVKDSPKDLQQLHSELKYLQAIATTLHTLTQTRDLTPVHLTVLQHPLNKLQDAQKLFDDCFSMRKNAGMEKPEFKRTIHRNKVRRLRKELDAVGQNFNTTLATVGLLKLSAISANLPDSYRLELSPTFSPEHCIPSGPILDPLSVYSTVEVNRTATLCVHKHFLLFAQRGRHWRHVIAITTAETQLDLMPVGQHLPAIRNRALGLICDLLQRTLSNVEDRLYKDVTKVHIEFVPCSLGSTHLISTEPHLSPSSASCTSPNNVTIVQEIQDRSIPVVLEAQIILIEQMAHSWHLVRVGNRRCLEQRIPFSDEQSPSLEQDPSFIFWQKIKPLLQLQGSPFIAKFAGAILDQTRTKLYGCLVILPERGTLDQIFLAAREAGSRISWEWKAKWIRQLALVLTDAHRRSVVIGQCNPNRLWLDANDDLILVDFFSLSDNIQGFPGNVPPEFRRCAAGGYADPLPGHELTFASDSFALGTAIWLICEQRRSTGGGIFCRRSPCTSLYTYSCTAPHHDPIELPLISMEYGIPAYVDSVVKACRQEEPSKRPSVATVLQILTDNGIFELRLPTRQIPVKTNLRDRALIRTRCDECGEVCYPEIYCCTICDQGQFDLCKDCFSQGVPCWDSDHKWYQKVLRNNQWVYQQIERVG